MLRALEMFDVKQLASYWNKYPVYGKNVSLNLSELPNIEAIISAFSGMYADGIWRGLCGVNINASRLGSTGLQNLAMNVDIGAARQYFYDGYSLCFGDMSNDFEALRKLRSEASEIFGHPELISVTGYLSPPGAVGVLHFDKQHNFFIQKQGRKKWLVSAKAAVSSPHENFVFAGVSQAFLDQMNSRGYRILLPRECGRNEFELSPGDVLYVPPGFYHSPETHDEPSLHYTLTVEADCFMRRFNRRMFDAMLSSGGLFTQDLRFMTEGDINKDLESCMNMFEGI